MTIHPAKLAPEVKKAVVEQAMSIMESEGFFEAEAGAEDVRLDASLPRPPTQICRYGRENPAIAPHTVNSQHDPS